MIGRRRLRRVPQAIGRQARIHLRSVWPPVGTVRLGGLDRIEPIGGHYGFDRGTPVDRHYIEMFLARHAASPRYGAGDIHGRVLEVGGDTYARRYGPVGPHEDTQIDVFHFDDSSPASTLVGDLTLSERSPDGHVRLRHLHAEPPSDLRLPRGDGEVCKTC